MRVMFESITCAYVHAIDWNIMQHNLNALHIISIHHAINTHTHARNAHTQRLKRIQTQHIHDTTTRNATHIGGRWESFIKWYDKICIRHLKRRTHALKREYDDNTNQYDFVSLLIANFQNCEKSIREIANSQNCEIANSQNCEIANSQKCKFANSQKCERERERIFHKSLLTLGAPEKRQASLSFYLFSKK